MNGQLYQVTAQHERCLASPENIYYSRNQRNSDDARIGQPGLSIAHRCKAKAVEQSAYSDGRKNRQGDGAEDGLKTDQ